MRAVKEVVDVVDPHAYHVRSPDFGAFTYGRTERAARAKQQQASALGHYLVRAEAIAESSRAERIESYPHPTPNR